MDEATATASANWTGKPLIESDQVEGTTVYDPQGNNLGSIKRLMIDKISGRVAYTIISLGGFLGMGAEEHAFPWSKLTYDTRLERLPHGHHSTAVARRADLRARAGLE